MTRHFIQIKVSVFLRCYSTLYPRLTKKLHVEIHNTLTEVQVCNVNHAIAPVMTLYSENNSKKKYTSQKHAYIILIPVNPTFI